MPTASERVPNRALSGDELRKLILADFERLLDQEGALGPHLAYGRVAYDIRLTLHTVNPLSPTQVTQLASRPRAKQELESAPALSAVEPMPLAKPRVDATLAATTLRREIDSPNAERLRTGMPIPVDMRQTDGTTRTERIEYPPDATVGSQAQVVDTTREAAADWSLLDAVQEIKVPAPEPVEIPVEAVHNSSPTPAPLTAEQIAAQTERISAIAAAKVAAMTPEEEARLNAAFGGQQ